MNDCHDRLIHLDGKERVRPQQSLYVKLVKLTWIDDCFGPHFLNRKAGSLSVFVFMNIAVTTIKLCRMLWFNILIENATGLLDAM